MVLANGLTLEESRAKRLEKQQSRYRHRFGTFVPAEHNPLLESLLARGINGESPSPRKPSSCRSTPRRLAARKSRAVEDEESDIHETVTQSKKPTTRKRVVGKEAHKSTSSDVKPLRGAGKKPTRASSSRSHRDPPEEEVDPEPSTSRTKSATPATVSNINPVVPGATNSRSRRSEKTKRAVEDVSDDEPPTVRSRKKAPPRRTTRSTVASKRKITAEQEQAQVDEDKESEPMKKSKAPSKRPNPKPKKEKPGTDGKVQGKQAKREEGERVPDKFGIEQEGAVAEAQPRKRARSEKKPPASRKRKKVEFAERNDEQETKSKPTDSPNLGLQPIKEPKRNPNIFHKSSTTNPRNAYTLNLLRSTRFSSPLRPMSDDEDPIDFLS